MKMEGIYCSEVSLRNVNNKQPKNVRNGYS